MKTQDLGFWLILLASIVLVIVKGQQTVNAVKAKAYTGSAFFELLATTSLAAGLLLTTYKKV